MNDLNLNNEMQMHIESNFDCQRCNACCRQPGYVYLKEGEPERIAAYLNLPLYDFTDQYCDVVDRRRLVLKKLPDEACVFLDDSGCRIHTVKPIQCSDFPSKWRMPEAFNYCLGLKEITKLPD